MSLYFGTDNDFTSKPSNGEGFNDWDLIKYKPDSDSKGYLSSLGIDSSTEWTYADVVANVAALSELTADVDSDGNYSNLKYLIDSTSNDLTEIIINRQRKADTIFLNGY